MGHFQSQNTPICPEQRFLVQNIIMFIYLLALFNGENFKKILTVNPGLWGYIIFGPKMVHLPQTKKFFLKKIINIIFIYLLAPFIVQNFKKSLTADPELSGCISFGPKIAHLPKWDFFQKTCSFHSSLSRCQRPKSDIHLLMKYWQLKNTEISLAENNFWL